MNIYMCLQYYSMLRMKVVNYKLNDLPLQKFMMTIIMHLKTNN